MYLSIDKFKEKLLNTLLHGSDIQEILDTYSSCFQVPVLLAKANNEIIAISPSNTFHTELFCQAATYRFLNIPDFPRYSARLVPHALTYREHSYCQVKLVSLGHSLYLLFLSELWENMDFSYEYIHSLGLTIETYFSRTQYKEEEYLPDNFLSNIFEKHITDEEILRKQARNLKLPLQKAVTLILARDISGNAFQINPLIYKNDISQLFPGSYIAFYKGYLFIFVFDGAQVRPDCSDMQKVQDFFYSKNIQACIGMPRFDFSSLYDSFTEACRIFHYSNEFRRLSAVIYSEQYAIYNLLPENVTGEFFQLCPPDIMQLFFYDQEHHSNYVLTLYAYILMCRNIPDMTLCLDLGYNTIKYRLNMLDTLLIPDWKDHLTTYYLAIKIILLLYPKQTEALLAIEQQVISFRR